MSNKRTPGPWRACVDWPNRPKNMRAGKILDTDDVTTETGQRVCRMTGDVKHALADARFIANACNSYDRLVEALKDCLRRRDDPSAILHIVNIALRDAGEEA